MYHEDGDIIHRKDVKYDIERNFSRRFYLHFDRIFRNPLWILLSFSSNSHYFSRVNLLNSATSVCVCVCVQNFLLFSYRVT